MFHPSRNPLDCWPQECQEQYRASSGLRCVVFVVVAWAALALVADLAGYHSIQPGDPAQSLDYRPGCASWSSVPMFDTAGSAPAGGTADLVLEADTADTVPAVALPDSTQTAVDRQLRPLLEAGTVGSPWHFQRRQAAVAAVASAEVESAGPDPEARAASS